MNASPSNKFGLGRTADRPANDETSWTQLFASSLGTFVLVIGLGSSSLAEVKKTAYPEVKVTVNKPYTPDAAFEKMRNAFADAVDRKDIDALAALVAPTFLWTLGGQPADEMDFGRDAIHNFKVVFGFRAPGKDADGGVEGGPFWDSLAALAADSTYYAATDAGNLVCGPIAADVSDDNAFDQANKKITTGDDQADWIFTLKNTDVAKAPGDTGAPIAKVGTIALPLLSVYPAAKEGQPELQPTYVEVLLPSGKSGWIAAAAIRQLTTDRLCYAKTPSGDWKIATIDQPSQ